MYCVVIIGHLGKSIAPFDMSPRRTAGVTVAWHRILQNMLGACHRILGQAPRWVSRLLSDECPSFRQDITGICTLDSRGPTMYRTTTAARLRQPARIQPQMIMPGLRHVCCESDNC